MFARYEVKGKSMEPGLKEGDRLLILRTSKVKEGDIVVIRKDEIEAVKRVKKISSSRLTVKGDNKEYSTDSRHYGAISRESIAGKVLLKY